MKVIVVEQTGYSGSFTHVYEYSREAYIQMVKGEFKWAKDNNCLENEDEVEEWLDDCEYIDGDPFDIKIIEFDCGVFYTVCEIEKTLI